MARVFLRHVNRLPRHCAAGVDRYLERLGATRADIAGPDAPGVDSARLLALGGAIARAVVAIAEAEEAAGRAGGSLGQE